MSSDAQAWGTVRGRKDCVLRLDAVQGDEVWWRLRCGNLDHRWAAGQQHGHRLGTLRADSAGWAQVHPA